MDHLSSEGCGQDVSGLKVTVLQRQHSLYRCWWRMNVYTDYIYIYSMWCLGDKGLDFYTEGMVRYANAHEMASEQICVTVQA